MPLKFSQESFNRLGLPDLLINIWSMQTTLYMTKNGVPANVIFLCVEAARKEWSDNYINFDYVIR